MDLKRMKNEDKLDLCRKYYLGGFALLPFLWGVNCVWFFRDGFLAEQFEEQKRIRTYVIRSMIGMFVGLVVFITWVVIFQKYRTEWGLLADDISFIIPKGEL